MTSRLTLIALLLAACTGSAPRETFDEDSEVALFGGAAESPAEEPEDVLAFEAGGDTGVDIRGLRRPRVRTWKRSQLVPNTSKLEVGDEEELPLVSMQVNAEVAGFRARVVLDLVYENDRKEQLEGAFRLRLPDGAAPYYLAFGRTVKERLLVAAARGNDLASIRRAHREAWSGGEVKEARMVPREKAAHAYGETVRRAVDPALLEWSGAGVFAARVFPLEPGELHRIVIGYEMNLLPAGEDLVYRLELPEKIPDLTIDLNVRGGAYETSPVLEADHAGFFHLRDPKQRAFEVRLTSPGPVLLRGRDPATGDCFAARFRPDLPAAPAATAGDALFLLDTSLSANPERFPIWLELLGAILERNEGSIRRFCVMRFDVDSEFGGGFVANTTANRRRVRDWAATIALEGATDLGAAFARLGELADRLHYDLFLLGDGAATWGESDPHALAALLDKTGARGFFAYDIGFSGGDTRLLRHLARERGGAVFTLAGEDELAEAATAHTRRPWRIESISVAGGSDLLLAGRPRVLYPGQALTIAGRGRLAEGTEVVLEVARDGERREVRTPLGRAFESDLAAGTYGQIAVGQLEELGDATIDTAQAYALHFRVVGRTCSLLMLESEEEYEAYGIKPEANAYVVGREPAAARVERAREGLGDALASPKRRFLSRVARLERIGFLAFEMPRALRLALEPVPDDAFRLPPARLRCRATRWRDVPGAVQEQLVSRRLDYDAITAEAARRRAKWGAPDALRALSSLVENRPGDTVLQSDVGYTALEWGLEEQACGLFLRVADRRPYEPHAYLALADCLARMDRPVPALLCWEIVLAGDWPDRYGELRRIVTTGYVRFLRTHDTGPLADYARVRRAELERGLEPKRADLVVVIAWNTDRTDVDLHVVDPNGEECFYSHRETKLGGRLSEDVTGGFGPEMFVLERAPRGKYAIRVKYFSSDRQRASARTRVFATIYENRGEKNERVVRRIVTLADARQMHDIATINR